MFVYPYHPQSPDADINPQSSPAYENEKGHGSEHVDLNNNVSAKIKNPLVDIPEETLLRDVEHFVNSNGLSEDADLFRRAALVAKDPANFESVKDIRDEEIEVIRDEVLHKWRQPWSLYFTVITCSIGAAVQ